MENNNKNIKVLISGGGTGGHIFPAIAIANSLKKTNNSIDILFVGAEGKMEMEKIPAAGYNIVGLPVIGLPRKLSVKIFVFIFKLIKSLVKARKIIKNFKPDIAVGVGGYAAGPALKMASLLKVPYVIQEQNSYPGITNRMLGKKAQKIFVAYDNMEKYFPAKKIINTGNPIRQDIKNTNINIDEAFEFFNLNKNKPTILITGGSLGALTINQSIYEGIEKLIDNNIQIIWQCGTRFIEKAKEKVEKSNLENVFVSDFIYKMDLAYTAADIIISRAGAITISELCIIKKPVILVPSPNVTEDHQTKNAMALVEKNAAVLIKDNEANNKLIESILKLISDNELRKNLQNNIGKLAKTDAADKIAGHIYDIIYDR